MKYKWTVKLRVLMSVSKVFPRVSLHACYTCRHLVIGRWEKENCTILRRSIAQYSDPCGPCQSITCFAFEPTAPLPIPDNDGDMQLLGEAIGSYVAWPTHLVALDKMLKKPKGNDKKIPRNESITSPAKIQLNKPPLKGMIKRFPETNQLHLPQRSN
ncbi:uncharacterized protein [Cicer arietinum]|uniref:uncharacterized protein isoform X1 n=1 Tax=Cicer arietinum TaxID=3827 RepID=UPI003CC56848